MSHYVDGFVIPIPKKNIAAYKRMAAKAAKIWREFGALDYKECVGDDLHNQMALSFPKGIRTKAGETVVFSWILYKSKAQRDRINARIMKDPRIAAMCSEHNMPFDGKRMLYGGFKVMVSI